MKCISKVFFLKKCYVNSFLVSSCVTVVATASSQYHTIGTYGPQLAIDKKIGKGDNNFFCSEKELQPWLQIAFPNERKISSVEITNR
jgi:hypothetical protein